MTTRRGFLGLVAGAAVLGTAGFVVLDRPSASGLLRSARLPKPFAVPLPVAAAARPVRTSGDTDYYELTQRAADVEIIPGTRTQIWGYDGMFPGPLFRFRSGRQAVVRIRNGLEVPTSTHLHGGVTPPDSDGYPTDLVRPNATKDYTYPLRQRAATLWYHDHRMDYSAPQVWRGLMGMAIVADDEDDNLPLPKDDHDIPLIICDRAFADDGSFIYPALRPGPGVEAPFGNGVLGDVILVNGAPWPVLEVDASKYRFRILNASNARQYRLKLDPGGDLVQVGSDVGLLAAPVRHTEIPVSPAERFDVVVDFAAYPVGTEVTLVNTLESGDTGRVMRFKVVRPGRSAATVPDRLSAVDKLGGPVATRTFDFRAGSGDGMRMWTVNGEMFDPDKTMARPGLGTVERWRFASDFHHPVHLHLAHFQVVARDNQRPMASDAGWKDTVEVRPYEVVEVLARFDGYRGRYMLHCHNLEHEDMGMMVNFDVG
ncbi:multicopper oxidase family protein [Actinocrispum wychmicini]|uniref:Multicopper oxidase CueO n=1 Tax=Actinocrispum wychmicini TaxID=1213861 RepID=A0A4R2J8H1_9PSEU|nr:multicopper oxidase family protein [Actinocrispum wychmicini]TCO52808.1 FtsP/CotA-like multicopper oxidase with cupredoxin domain [Actinocrispum wychmicini]